MQNQPLISIIIPTYNEEGNIDKIYKKIKQVLSKDDFEIIFIDDGSIDDSLSIIKKNASSDRRVKYISLSRNFGHQNALNAGYDMAQGDCVISMDADLQHPVELIPILIDYWKKGYDIVFTIRDDKENARIIKKVTARLFYFLINKLSDVNIPAGSADFRLLDRRIVMILRKNFSEKILFYRGIIPWLGFKQKAVRYIPEKRNSGKTKYSFYKMLNFAFSGITSFSIKPLRLAILLGIITISLAFIYGLYILYMYIFTNKLIQGWSSLIMTVLVMGGVNMFLLGIIGEYIGKIAFQIKERPTYLIKETNIKKYG